MGIKMLKIFPLFFLKRENLKKQEVVPITVLKCPSCNSRNTRIFKENDFIFKETDKCPKCGGTMIIVGIYVEERKSEEKI
jgi:ssDNA-binding Zn-finger/Zn-ribbon topoisomerase 1